MVGGLLPGEARSLASLGEVSPRRVAEVMLSVSVKRGELPAIPAHQGPGVQPPGMNAAWAIGPAMGMLAHWDYPPAVAFTLPREPR